ncbi:MAG: hypothetical protein HZB41_11350 [Ignavibacteriae bacterium]|nr:hypothetical protein [Ignavibacteriota bacterium]
MRNKYIFLLVIIIISNVNILSSTVKWRIFGNLNQPRTFINAVPISDYEIIVIGGYNSFITDKNLSSCEIIDLKKDTIIIGPSMNFPRSYYATVVTKDSNIIVVSGCMVGTSELTPSVEMFDKNTRKWKFLGNLEVARWQHNAELLNDHEIIVIGGRLGDQSVINSVEIFDLNSGISKTIDPYPFPSSDGVSGYTSKGNIIAFGGRSGGPGSYREKNIYYYDTLYKNWWQIGMLNFSVNKPSLLKLLDLKLLCAGGSINELPDSFSNEIYLENNGLFDFKGYMFYNRIRFGVTQYNSDSVIIVGGYLGNRNLTGKCEWYNFKTNEITPAPELNFARFNHATVTLPDPNNKLSHVILVIGGNINDDQSLSSVEILRDSIVFIPPKICDIISDCDNFYFTVSDSNLIDRVELTGFDNQNVRVSTNETLPSRIVHVVVSVINPKQNGYFEVTCYSNKTGLSAIVKDTILNDIYYLNVISPLKNGSIDMGDTVINNTKCVDILIENNGFNDITIDSSNLVTNIEFYFPAGQMPLNIPYSQQKTLRLCFLPTLSGNFTDTLYLKDNCDSLMFLVRARSFNDFPPKITETRSDCFKFFFTVTDSNYIDKIELFGQNNVNVTCNVLDSLPSIVAHVIVSLIDINKEGVFNISCFSNKTGLSSEIGGFINADLSHLYTHFPYPGTFIFVFDTIVNESKCENLIIENKGMYEIRLDSAFLSNFSEFYIPGNQLPIFIPPGGSKQLTICFKSSTPGLFSDTLFLTNFCDTLKLPIFGTAYGNEPSQIIDSSYDCTHYYLTVVDSNYINRVELSGSDNKNVQINITEKLPSRIIHLKISLIEPDRNGYFTITFYCLASNKSLDRKGVIYSRPQYLLILEPVHNGIIDLGKIEFPLLKCTKVLLQNTGPQSLVLDYARLTRNIEFSIPQYQLPLTIPPGERAELELCYTPSEFTEQYDTLTLNDLCDTLSIPVKALCDTNIYAGESKCQIPLSGRTLSIENQIIIGNPYPNPGEKTASVEIYLDSLNNSNGNITASIFDNTGNIMPCQSSLFEENVEMQKINYFYKKLTFEIKDLTSGTYFIQIGIGNIKKVYPYFILR